MTSSFDSLLKSVSRSFYLSLRILPASLRPAMSVGYLLCRAADTIADTDAVSSGERLACLLRFRALFERFPVPVGDAAAFIDRLPLEAATSASAEGRLMARMSDCIAAFNALSRTDQAIVQQVVRAVTIGMETDLRIFGAPDGTLRGLETDEDLESYLLSIGGEPGRFWSGVCREHVPPFRAVYDEELMEIGIRFGKGLQMVNILRDVGADAARGRCYIPRERLAAHQLTIENVTEEKSLDRFLTIYHELIDETVERLRNGLVYVRRVPRGEWRLRAAVWWPLTLAIRTLALLRREKDPLRGKLAKISRSGVYGMMLGTAGMLPVNRCLTISFERWAAVASSRMDRA